MVDFLEDLPSMDAADMEDLYRHFLVDELPEDDDGDEDFEPPPDEEEEGEEADTRRRNIQARELNDLLHDAFQQNGPSAIPPGLRERVLDQLSMHFQLLVQAAVLSVKAGCYEEAQRALGMLEHLHASCEEGDHRRRTRARGNSSTSWDSLGDGLPAVSVPGLLPVGTLRRDIMEAGQRTSCVKGKSQQKVEHLMASRGGVIWPQLLPGGTRGRITGHVSTGAKNGGSHKTPLDTRQACNSERPNTFSMVEDRLLCRGVHLHGVDWESIRENMLPHKSTADAMHRYTILSGWVSTTSTAERPPTGQGVASPWTFEEDWKLKNAVEMFGKKWARIARDVMPCRGRESLRNRWSFLQSSRCSGVAAAQAANPCGASPERWLEKGRGVERVQASTDTPSKSTLTPTAATTFDEDELSDYTDECQDGPPVAGSRVDESGLVSDGLPSGKRLFEEDELSDDECSSLHNGAVVPRRTRARHARFGNDGHTVSRNRFT
eukprot:g13246.t1